jgi:hypothetical protein
MLLVLTLYRRCCALSPQTEVCAAQVATSNDLYVADCDFHRLRTNGSGGAIFVGPSGPAFFTLSIARSVFRKCIAVFRGGAIDCFGRTANITSSSGDESNSTDSCSFAYIKVVGEAATNLWLVFTDVAVTRGFCQNSSVQLDASFNNRTSSPHGSMDVVS